MNATATETKTVYRVVSWVYMGGGELSRHRTLSGAERAIAKHDASIRHLNRYGGTSYHDCRIEENSGNGWTPINAD